MTRPLDTYRCELQRFASLVIAPKVGGCTRGELTAQRWQAAWRTFVAAGKWHRRPFTLPRLAESLADIASRSPEPRFVFDRMDAEMMMLDASYLHRLAVRA